MENKAQNGNKRESRGRQTTMEEYVAPCSSRRLHGDADDAGGGVRDQERKEERRGNENQESNGDMQREAQGTGRKAPDLEPG